LLFARPPNVAQIMMMVTIMTVTTGP